MHAVVCKVTFQVGFSWADIIASVFIPIEICNTRHTVIRSVNTCRTVNITRVAGLCCFVREVTHRTNWQTCRVDRISSEVNIQIGCVLARSRAGHAECRRIVASFAIRITEYAKTYVSGVAVLRKTSLVAGRTTQP